MNGRITIIVADDHPVFLAGLRQVLAHQADIEILAEAGDGREALSLIRTLKPAVAVLDVDMPVISGIALAEQYASDVTETALVLLTGYDDTALLDHAMKVGVRGYILKDAATADIARCIRSVYAGELFVSPSMPASTRHRWTESADGEETAAALAQLTPAEQEVLRYVAENRTSAEIADKLCISVHTVNRHRANICRKLDLRGAHALARFALQHGVR